MAEWHRLVRTGLTTQGCSNDDKRPSNSPLLAPFSSFVWMVLSTLLARAPKSMGAVCEGKGGSLSSHLPKNLIEKQIIC